MLTVDNAIRNPFSRGDSVLIPAGTPIRTTNSNHSRKIAARGYRVTVFSANSGWIDIDGSQGHGRGYVILPEICWVGTGGYWHTVKVTPEFAGANQRTLPDPTFPEQGLSRLDTIPCYGAGYANRDTFTADDLAAETIH